MVEYCFQLGKLKGIHALRLSYLNGGAKSKEIPPISVFTENYYKNYNLTNIPYETMENIV